MGEGQVKSLETVIADWRENANVVEKFGDKATARTVRLLLDDIEKAARSYLTMLPEKDAALWCGLSVTWLRGRFKEWAAAGHAEKRGRSYYYRAIVLPRRNKALADAYAEGRGDDAGRAA